MRYTITALAACVSSAAAVGSAVVANNCTSTIYAWSVGSAVGAKQTIAAGTLERHYITSQKSTNTRFQEKTSPSPSTPTPNLAASRSR
jgi:hypothetical protein